VVLLESRIGGQSGRGETEPEELRFEVTREEMWEEDCAWKKGKAIPLDESSLPKAG
jgi:hypothetical protein